MKNVAAAVLFLMVGTASPAYLADGVFMGFSEDGSLAALHQYWVQDGSGFPGAEIIVVSTEDGRIVQRFEKMWGEEEMYADGEEMWFQEGENPASRIVLEEAGDYLLENGFSMNENCSHCICHPLTDLTADPHTVGFSTRAYSLLYMGPEYRVELKTPLQEMEDPPQWLSMFGEPVLLSLEVLDEEGNPVYSFSDETAEEGYQYVSDYRIQDVYVQDDRFLAVILNTTEPGFEGADSHFRLVAGSLY